MNKAELVAALEGRLGSKKVAADALEAVVDTITRTVARGERVVISGFGSFEKTMRGARVGRNPRTGEKVKIKKTSVPRFKPGTAFKTYVSDPKALPKAVAGSAAVTGRQVTRAASVARAAAAAPAKAAVKAPAKAAAKAPAKAAAKAPAKAAVKAPAKAAVKAPAKVAAKAPAKAAVKAPAKAAVKAAVKAPAKVAAKAPAKVAAKAPAKVAAKAPAKAAVKAPARRAAARA